MEIRNTLAGPDIWTNPAAQRIGKQMCLQLARCEPLHNIYDTYLPKADKTKFCTLAVLCTLTFFSACSSGREQSDLILLPDAQRAWVVKVGVTLQTLKLPLARPAAQSYVECLHIRC